MEITLSKKYWFKTWSKYNYFTLKLGKWCVSATRHKPKLGFAKFIVDGKETIKTDFRGYCHLWRFGLGLDFLILKEYGKSRQYRSR